MNKPEPFPFVFVDTDDTEQHAAWSNADPRTICNKPCRPFTVSELSRKDDHCRICNMVWHERARNSQVLDRYKADNAHLLSRLDVELTKNQRLSAELEFLRGSAPDGTQILEKAPSPGV